LSVRVMREGARGVPALLWAARAAKCGASDGSRTHHRAAESTENAERSGMRGAQTKDAEVAEIFWVEQGAAGGGEKASGYGYSVQTGYIGNKSDRAHR